MPRITLYATTMVVFAALSSPVLAQAPEPTELARGLREAGLADLALEYLDELSTRKLSPAAMAVIPLEKARAKLILADEEPDDSKRATLVSEARNGFEQFLKESSNHPRRAEAAISLARVISVQAKGMVSSANKIDGKDERKAAMARTRPIFEEAAKRFGQAAAEYAKKLDDPSLTPSQKRELTRDVLQAKLDRAINYFRLATTYDPPEGVKEIQLRGTALDQSRDLFIALGKEDVNHPLCWVAMAWSGECEREKTNPREAETIFNRVYDAAKAKPQIAGLGARTARFFDLKATYLDSVGANDTKGLNKAQLGFEAWLNDPLARVSRPAPEVHQARYYLAFSKQRQAELSMKKDAKSGAITIPTSARDLLTSAEKDYKRVAESENDYTNRAAERRTQVIRILLGDGDINPARMNDLERILMAAQVQLYKAMKEAKNDDDKKASLKKVIALYERARELPVSKELTKDSLDGQLNLAFAYISSQMPYQAAILGEYLARTVRQPVMAAKAGYYAMQAYSLSAGKLDPTDTDGRRADLERIANVGLFLDKQFPLDPNTDNARMMIAQQWLRDGRYKEAFDLVGRINSSSTRLPTARLMQGVAAYELLRPAPAGTETMTMAKAQELAPDQKGAIFQRALTDLSSLPPAPVNAPAGDAKISVLVSLQIAELNMLDRPRGYLAAEQVSKAAYDRIATYTELSAEEKQDLQFKIEHARLRAVYGQIFPLFQDKKYGELMTRLAPILGEMVEAGPASKPGLADAPAASARRLDEFRRNELIVLALRARIQEGSLDKAAELFDLLKKFGGSLQASLQAISNLVSVVKPQVDQLHREKKDKEADQLIAGVSQMLDKVSGDIIADPTKYAGELVVLGRSLKDLGSYDKAIDLLKKVPAPPAADLRKKLTDLDETSRPPVTRYRVGTLELIRSYRLAKKFTEADKLLQEALGTRDFKDKAKDKPGWAANDLNYRKEAVYLLEAKASNASDNKQSTEFWGQANQQWGLIGREYFSIVTTGGGKGPAKDDREKQDRERVKAQFKPIYHDLVYEQLRCVTKANQHVFKSAPEKLAPKLTGVARQMVALEKSNPDLAFEVKVKFAELMEEVPPLKAEYEKQPDNPKGLLKAALNTAGSP
jgi:hypothetical protein